MQRKPRALARLGGGDGVDQLEQGIDRRDRLDTEDFLFIENGKHGRAVARKSLRQQASRRATVRQAQHCPHLLGGDVRLAVLGLGMGDGLVEDREAVARGALGGDRDHCQRIVVGAHILLFRHLREVLLEQFGRNAPQVETLAARQHRDRHLVHFGRGEEELHMRRRLLKSLEQRIESIARQHVDFVDDVDLVARRNRRVAHRLDDLANVVDTGVRGRVHLDHIDVSPFRDRLAGLANAARVNGRPSLTVGTHAIQRLCDKPRC